MSSASEFEIVEGELSWHRNAAWLYPDGDYPEWAAKAGKTLVKYRGKQTHVVIPQGVREIGDKAFFRNTTLQSVVIPESVYYPGMRSFCGCTNLRLLVFEGTVQVWPGLGFIDRKSDAMILFKGNSFRGVQEPIRSNALSGFLYAFENSIELDKNVYADNLAFLKRRRKKLYLEAIQRITLLKLMLDERLIPKKEIGDILSLAQATKNVEAAAMILAYSNQ